MNAGQRLAELSGLSGVSAATHLLAIKQSGATAGAMLLSASPLSTGTALAHLLAITKGEILNPKIFPNHDENDWMQERFDSHLAREREESEALSIIQIFLMTRH
jgi:hypothetical protein